MPIQSHHVQTAFSLMIGKEQQGLHLIAGIAQYRVSANDNEHQAYQNVCGVQPGNQIDISRRWASTQTISRCRKRFPGEKLTDEKTQAHQERQIEVAAQGTGLVALIGLADLLHGVTAEQNKERTQPKEFG